MDGAADDDDDDDDYIDLSTLSEAELEALAALDDIRDHIELDDDDDDEAAAAAAGAGDGDDDGAALYELAPSDDPDTSLLELSEDALLALADEAEERAGSWPGGAPPPGLL